MINQMIRTVRLAFVGVVVTLAVSCDTTVVPPEENLTSVEAAGRDFPQTAEQLVYKYRLASVNADSLLRVMVRAQVPVKEAWLPLEDLCADAVGPRFTVILTAADSRMQSFGFDQGSGIRACTTKVKRYVLGQ
jgi:hypothetical protein